MRIYRTNTVAPGKRVKVNRKVKVSSVSKDRIYLERLVYDVRGVEDEKRSIHVSEIVVLNDAHHSLLK